MAKDEKKITGASAKAADHAHLDENQKEALRAKAREKAQAKVVAEAEDAFLKEETERAEYEARQKLGILGNEEEVTHTLDLAPNTPWISINGERFYHGKTYTRKLSVMNDIRSMEYQGWKMERIRLGEDVNAFGIDRRQPGAVVRA